MPRRTENPKIEQLAEELSRPTNCSQTGVIALQRRQRLLAFLKNRVWPQLPEGASQPWTKEEEERALGFGEHGECV